MLSRGRSFVTSGLFIVSSSLFSTTNTRFLYLWLTVDDVNNERHHHRPHKGLKLLSCSKCWSINNFRLMVAELKIHTRAWKEPEGTAMKVWVKGRRAHGA